VRGTTPREVREAYLVRGELEGLAAELATPHLSDDELEQLHEAQVLFRTAIEHEIANRRTGRDAEPWSAENDWERANNLFHEVIQRASGNRQLQLAIAHLHRSFPRHLTWAALSKSAHLLGDNVQQHSAIVEAIERRDPREARRLMAQHVHDAGELVAVLLERSH
jgi:DNA-binding GntR family transcriptional regulator